MDIVQTLNVFLSKLTVGIFEAMVFVSFFWIIHLINILFGRKLNCFGIIPREPISLITGPFCSSFLHVDANHLLYNSVPLLCMTSLLFSQGIVKAISIIICISVLKSLLVWIFARKGIHIGASGLVVGLFSFLIFQGYANPSIIHIIITVIILYYFGSIFLSLFPSDFITSHEGHVAGFVSGITVLHFGTPSFLTPFSYSLAKTITYISQAIF